MPPIDQDELLKTAFRRRGGAGDFKVIEFVPATGIGKFNASYSPLTHKLQITVKVAYDFKRDLTKPEQLAWTGGEELTFKTNTKATVEAFWKNRYIILCKKAGWTEFFAEIEVTLEEVPRNQAAYLIAAHKLALYKSSGGIDHGQVPHVCGVNNHANVVDQTKKTNQIFNYKEGLIRNHLRGRNPTGQGDFIAFEKNSHSIPPSLSLSFGRWCAYAKNQLGEDLVGVKAFCVGLRGKSDDWKHRRLSSRRANAIRDLINTKVGRPGNDFAETLDKSSPIVKNMLRTLKQRPINLNNTNNPTYGLGGVMIVIGTHQTVTRNVPPRFVVMNHEFGHMLGLPDEYMGVQHDLTASKAKLDAIFPATYQNAANKLVDRTALMQQGLTEAAALANIPLPNFMGTSGSSTSEEAKNYDQTKDQFYDDRTAYRDSHSKRKYESWKRRNPFPEPKGLLTTVSSSIMHSGCDVLPAHYLTIWSALCIATSTFLDPEDWEISPHPISANKTKKFFSGL